MSKPPPPKKKSLSSGSEVNGPGEIGKGLGQTPVAQNPETGKPEKSAEIGQTSSGCMDELFDVYYNSGGKDYWMQDSRSIFRPYGERALRRELVSLGLESKAKDGTLSQIDETIRQTERTKCPSYIGPLAGHEVGPTEVQGKLVLVTESMRRIEPIEGGWLIIRKLIEQQFKHADVDQTSYIYGWLQFLLECQRSGNRFPGQILTMAGPRKCGKSILQNEIITPICGGRSERPMRYLRGGSEFNSELFGAGHLMLEDEIGSPDPRARRSLGTALKQIASNRVHSCHAKGKEALSLDPLWRCSISLNDETENLMVLPIIDESLSDKIVLLLARKFPMPMPTETASQKAEFARQIKEELPAFVHFLLNWKIPAALRSHDYGVTHFHHPVVLQSIQELSPEYQLWNLIHEKIFVMQSTWVGTATELQEHLIEESSSVARSLFSWPTACGTYLGRLESKFPELVSWKRIDHGSRVEWKLKCSPV